MSSTSLRYEVIEKIRKAVPLLSRVELCMALAFVKELDRALDMINALEEEEEEEDQHSVEEETKTSEDPE
jgi:hypothetical protein